MNRFFYSTLFYLATPMLLLRLLWRSRRAAGYRARWRERFALYDRDNKPNHVDIVFHAVSVGEVHAAVPLIRQLLLQQPSMKILVTTTTPTGSARVSALLANSVSHVYLPYDIPGAVMRFLNNFSPRLLVIMETEWWPNLLHYSHHRGIKIMLANARLSEKSQQNYAGIAKLAGNMLAQFDCITAQSAQDSERLQVLGSAQAKIQVVGSMKYDIPLNREQLAQAHDDKAAFNERPVWIAASTRILDGEAEEEKVLAAFKAILVRFPEALLVLVPRHPERFDGIVAMAQKAGLGTLRRSSKQLPGASDQVLVGDSMGEMHYYFGLADAAFVGGSLVNTGCQNIIEPAAMGLPVITGPSRFNFQTVSDQLVEAGGLALVADENELAQSVCQLFENAGRRKAMGEAARKTVEANQGATLRNLEIISDLLGSLTGR